jgi:DNA invertase Pin-like site-specific DNA recombinase
MTPSLSSNKCSLNVPESTQRRATELKLTAPWQEWNGTAALGNRKMTTVGHLSDLGTSPIQIMDLIQLSRAGGPYLECSRDGFDTRAPTATQIRAALQELTHLERNLFSEQVRDEIAEAHRRAKRAARPKVMTPERQAVAAQMLAVGKRGEFVLNLIRTLEGPSISLSSYYNWQKAWLERNGSSPVRSKTVGRLGAQTFENL